MFIKADLLRFDKKGEIFNLTIGGRLSGWSALNIIEALIEHLAEIKTSLELVKDREDKDPRKNERVKREV